MMITLDISNEEFDRVVGDTEITPTIFLNFPRDIRGVYEFEFINVVVNVFPFKEQIDNQGIHIDDETLFIFGKMKVRVENVKGADFKFVEGDFITGRKQYHTWPYTLNRGDVVCITGGDLSFLPNYYASIYIVTESRPKITLTFDTDESVPYNCWSSSSTKYAKSKETKYAHTNSQGKLLDVNFLKEYLGVGRTVIKDE